jgi:hypothetical protein
LRKNRVHGRGGRADRTVAPPAAQGAAEARPD